MEVVESDNVVGGGKSPSEEDELSDSAGVRDGTRKDPGDDSEVKSIGDNIASRSLSWVRGLIENDDMFSLSLSWVRSQTDGNVTFLLSLPGVCDDVASTLIGLAVEAGSSSLWASCPKDELVVFRELSCL